MTRGDHFLTRIRARLSWLLLMDSLLLGLGVSGFIWYFYQSYGPRLLLVVAGALALVGFGTIFYDRRDLYVPIQLFFLGTWAYNFFEGRWGGLVWIMLFFLIILAYGFWSFLDRPARAKLALLPSLYLSLATLIVWELAILIHLFWPVDPSSRMFLVIAALVFLQLAMRLRLSGQTSPVPLVAPLVIILMLMLAVISSTPIAFY